MSDYNVLVTDPPWEFKDSLPGKKRGAKKHYKCLAFDRIKGFELPPLSNDCWLFMWRVGAMQAEALEVAKHLGFRVVTEIVWVKTPRILTPEQIARRAIRMAIETADCGPELWSVQDVKMGKANAALVAELAAKIAVKQARRVRIGMGHSLRNAHEVCLVCKRGRPFKADAGVPSVIFGERGAHSSKPDEFYRTVNRFVGAQARIVELFARRQQPGWTCLGDQMPKGQ